MSERNLDAELAAVEATLTELVPAESSLSRDRVMYLAGMAAGRSERSATTVGWALPTECTQEDYRRAVSHSVGSAHPTSTRRLRLWRATSAVATLLACALGVALWLRPEPQIVIQRVEIPVETPRAADGLAGVELESRDDAVLDPEAAQRRIEETAAYLRTWRALATGGLDALPSPQQAEPVAPAPRRPEKLRDLLDELQRGNG
jgi:hypothetical protein